MQVDLEKSSLVSADEVKLLQDQNDNLKLVVKEMRSQMETLGHEIPAEDKQSPRGQSVSEG